MKRLYVLRHAKSSWDDPSLSDFERPLNSRGLKAAPFMGELMGERGLVPDVIISSPAARARSTAEMANEAGGFGASVQLDDGVYEASREALLAIVKRTDERYASVLLVGHNPGIEGFIHLLTGSIERMPTAALAVIDLDVDKWSEVAPRLGRLENVIRPRDVMSEE